MGEGKQAPDITLKAVVSNRQVNLRKPGAVLVLVMPTQATTEAVSPLRAALRERFPDPAKVVIASVLDLRQVPRLMRKMGESALANRYKEVIAGLEAGQDPAQYVVMCPDWNGEVPGKLGLADLGSELGVAVITADGMVAGTYRGLEPLEATAELVSGLIRGD
ncbi:MAG TPA: hypothetical protein PKD75_11625 [Tepidiformaceae bacterium]|nr:hypothetical protein [Tepidiformaceae bacterium]